MTFANIVTHAEVVMADLEDSFLSAITGGKKALDTLPLLLLPEFYTW